MCLCMENKITEQCFHFSHSKKSQGPEYKKTLLFEAHAFMWLQTSLLVTVTNLIACRRTWLGRTWSSDLLSTQAGWTALAMLRKQLIRICSFQKLEPPGREESHESGAEPLGATTASRASWGSSILIPFYFKTSSAHASCTKSLVPVLRAHCLVGETLFNK